ncbi:Cysteine-rich receptor-like protein kinase 8 [Bienertia sinuspersici]
MDSPTFLYIVLTLSPIFAINLVTAQFNSFTNNWCSNTTYSTNSTYQSNLHNLLNKISNDTKITYGFYNFTVGHTPDRVHSLALCRGDVPVNTCRLCIRNAATLLPQVCPNNIEAFGYSGYCSIFISNRSIYGKVQDLAPWSFGNNQNVDPKVVGFNETLISLMSSLQNQAASGDSKLKYAAGKTNLTGGGGQMLYGLVQCTPDLSRKNCMQCIQKRLDELPLCCSLPSEVNMVQQSCFLKYSTNPFFGNVPDLPMSSPPPLFPSKPMNNNRSTPTEVKKTGKSYIIPAIAISIGVSAILTIIIGFIMLSRRAKLRKSWMVQFSKDEIQALKSLQFSLGAIKHATNNFSDDYKLGQGGFGSVYKGVLADGQEIAVKRLLRNSKQGDAEFKNEILILAKLRHRNLVTLIGFCLHGKEMILVYEFVANRSLDYFIFDPLKRQSMMWETRYNIINGIARGIRYLHEGSRLTIIHRDLKAGNVLLDAEFDAKIADFGLARLFDIDQTQTLASKIMEGTPMNLVDPALLPTISSTEILRCIHIGLLCVQHNPIDRPTMSSIDLMLSSNSDILEVPLQPAFFMNNRLPSMLSQWNNDTQSTNTSGGGSINGVTISEIQPR